MDLSVSILNADFYNLHSQLKVLKACKIKYLHLDVMDGSFVPNISFGMPIIKSIKDNVNNDFILDTHLMIVNPDKYIEDFKNIGCNIITIHKEACDDYLSTLNHIKDMGVLAGISINPDTPVSEIDNALQVADLILIMSVNPGFGGQKFIDSSLQKIEYLNNKKKLNNYKYLIEVDGGINNMNIKNVTDTGCDLIVAGSSIFKGDITTNINNLKGAVEWKEK